MSREVLTDLARRSLSVTSPLATLIQRAAYFDHHVRLGGFTTLIYHLKGEGLQEVEAMLETVGAPIAHAFYLRAIDRCLQDMPAYQAFLTDYRDGSTKQALQSVTQDYYRTGTEFPDEILPWLMAANHEL